MVARPSEQYDQPSSVVNFDRFKAPAPTQEGYERGQYGLGRTVLIDGCAFTSAMEAGIADRFWTPDELVGLLDTPASVAA